MKNDIVKLSYKKQKKFLLISIIMLILGIICIILGYKWNFINYFLGAFLLIAFIAYLIISLNLRKKIKSSFLRYSPSEFDDMNNAINNCVKHDKKNQLIFTEYEIIDYHEGIDMFKYSNVIWMFPYIIRHNKKEKEWYVTFITQDKRSHKIKNIEKFEQVTDNEYNDLMKYVHDRNDRVLIGYTDENIEYMKENFNYQYENK